MLNVSSLTNEHMSDSALASSITKAASNQTYYTIRFLVDHQRVDDAYRAYAYFRWLDDSLDTTITDRRERLAFVGRQKTLVDRCYEGRRPFASTPEEQMLIDLIESDHERYSGLQMYVCNMMAVMEFDANRRGHLIAQTDLDIYTYNLASAVTEAMHYYIGHGGYTPKDKGRYLAVTAAHITHMLRDTYDDVAEGYFNIPREYLSAHRIEPYDIGTDAYRAWVKGRVALARDYFKAGRKYMSQVQNWRCRIAGYSYMARFTSVLDAIERENYWLRPEYDERKNLKSGLGMAWSVLAFSLRNPLQRSAVQA